MAILSSSHGATPTGIDAPHELKAGLIPTIAIGMARKTAGTQIYSGPRTYKLVERFSRGRDPNEWFDYELTPE